MTTALDGHAGDRKVEPREDVEEEMLLQPEASKEKAPSKWGAKLKGWGASISAGSAAAAAAYKKKAAELAEKSKEYKASLKEKSKEWGKKKDGKALYRGGTAALTLFRTGFLCPACADSPSPSLTVYVLTLRRVRTLLLGSNFNSVGR